MFEVRAAFNKAADSYENHAFLQAEVVERLTARLDIINPKPLIAADFGAGTGFLTKKLQSRYPQAQILALDFAQNHLQNNDYGQKICADAAHLPLKNTSIDVITSSLMLQWCDDLDLVLSECFRVLRDDGLLLFSTLGPDTLKELKTSWAAVDDNQHINNFIDMHDIGDKMLAAGWQNPIMEMEILTMTYQKVPDVLLDLQKIGSKTTQNIRKTLTGKNRFKQMVKLYESYRRDGKLPATFEIIYGHAFKKSSKFTPIKITNQN